MAEETESAPKKGLLKLILLGVVALAVLGGAGFGIRLFLKHRAAVKAAALAAGGKPAPPAEDKGCGGAGENSPVMVLTRNVNLSGPSLNAFLHCELNIIFCDQDLGKAAASDKPSPEKAEIESIVLDALTGRSVEEAMDPDFRDSLRKDIKDKLNAQFGPQPLAPGEKPPKKEPPRHPVKDVLIVDWAIQQ